MFQPNQRFGNRKIQHFIFFIFETCETKKRKEKRAIQAFPKWRFKKKSIKMNTSHKLSFSKNFQSNES